MKKIIAFAYGCTIGWSNFPTGHEPCNSSSPIVKQLYHCMEKKNRTIDSSHDIKKSFSLPIAYESEMYKKWPVFWVCNQEGLSSCVSNSVKSIIQFYCPGPTHENLW